MFVIKALSSLPCEVVTAKITYSPKANGVWGNVSDN